MTKPERRHPNVVHVDEIPAEDWINGTRFGEHYKPVAHHAGAKSLGASWCEVPPGRVANPYHYHCANEEGMYVLEGRGRVRIGAATVEVGPGDWLSFPVGPEHAHQVENVGDVPLRFLAISTMLPTEVVGYPDSKKIAARAARPGTAVDEKPWVMHITEEEAAVEYFHREKME